MCDGKRGGKDAAVFVPKSLARAPQMIAILELGPWVGCSMQWRALVERRIAFVEDVAGGLVAEQTSDEKPLLQLAAENAFWRMGMVSLQALAELVGVDLGSGGDLFQTVYSLMEAILPKWSKADLLRAIAVRGLRMAAEASTEVQDIVDMDECSSLLDSKGHKKFKEDCEKPVSLKQTVQEFKSAAQRKRQELGIVRGDAPSRKRAKKGNPLIVPRLGETPHSMAKALLRQGGYIWRANREGAWCARLPPFGCASRSVAKYGERLAVLLCLRHVWTQYSDLHGVPEGDIPIEGLFGPDFESGLAAGTLARGSRSAGSQAQ